MNSESSNEVAYLLRQAENTLQRSDWRAALNHLQRHSAGAALAVCDAQMSFFGLLDDEELVRRTEVLMDAAFYLTTIATLLLDLESDAKSTIEDLDDRIDDLLNQAGRMLEAIARHSAMMPRSILPHYYLNAALNYEISEYLAKSWVMAKSFQGELHGERPAMGTPLQYYYRDVTQLLTSFLLRDLPEVADILNNQIRWRKDHLVDWVNQAVEAEDVGIEEISRLVAMYDMAAAIERFSHFLASGDEQSELGAGRLIENAIEIMTEAQLSAELRLASLLRLAMRKAVRRSIWHQLGTLNGFPHAYLERLVRPVQARERPIYELWKSQKRAVEHGILDGYGNGHSAATVPARHYIVTMQTGAGKTLLGEMEIAQLLAHDDAALCLYIVPTRALASQAERELGRRLSSIGIHPLSLSGTGLSMTDVVRVLDTRVLITTPEKLSSILTRRHDETSAWAELLSPDRVRLVIVDEAHLIGSQDARGLLLEMLLLRLRHVYPEARILLQSAVIQNSTAISRWLNEDREWADDSAVVVDDWAPTDLLYGVLRRDGVLEYENGVEIPMLAGPARRGATNPPVQLVLQYCLPRGAKTLVFVSTQSRAAEIAVRIAGLLPRQEAGDLPPALARLVDAVEAELAATGLRLLADDGGRAPAGIPAEEPNHFPLIECLRKRVAFHHAGLPGGVRSIVERAVRSGEINVVVATTTLAEGLNLPVSCVIIADLSLYNPRIRRREPIPKMLLRNIAGRAGRPYEDTRGEVIIVQPGGWSVGRAKKYWIRGSQDVEPVTSSLRALCSEIGPTPRLSLDGPLARAYQAQLLSALREEAIDEADPRAFVRKTLLAYDDSQVRSVETLLQHTYAQLAYIEEQVPIERLPVFERTGFPVQVCGEMLRRIEVNTSTERQFYRLYRVGKDAEDERRAAEVLKMAFLPFGFDEAVDNLGVLRDWISGDSIVTIAQGYFHRNGAVGYDEVLNCSSYIERAMKLYAAWGLSGFGHLLGFWKESVDPDVEYTSVIELLPRFAGYGVNHPVAVYLQDLGILNRGDALLASRAFDASEELSYDARMDFITTLSWVRSAERDAFHQVMEEEEAQRVYESVHDYSASKLDQDELALYANEIAP